MEVGANNEKIWLKKRLPGRGHSKGPEAGMMRKEADSLKQWRKQRVGGGDFPGGAVVKNLPANAGDTGLSPGPGRSHMLQSN